MSIRPGLIIKFAILLFTFCKYSLYCSLEDLLKAGINEAESLILVNKESRQSSKEEQALEDCKTNLAVQFIFR